MITILPNKHCHFTLLESIVNDSVTLLLKAVLKCLVIALHLGEHTERKHHCFSTMIIEQQQLDIFMF